MIQAGIQDGWTEWAWFLSMKKLGVVGLVGWIFVIVVNGRLCVRFVTVGNVRFVSQLHWEQFDSPQDGHGFFLIKLSLTEIQLEHVIKELSYLWQCFWINNSNKMSQKLPE